MKVALVHDWLLSLRGGEKCLKYFLELYPSADIFTLFHKEGATYPEIDRRVKAVSTLQKASSIVKDHRKLLPLFPAGIRSLKIRGYDLVVSISHAGAKNVVLAGEETVHICYCLTPMRYIWDQVGQYFGAKRFILYPAIEYLRKWDKRGAEKVDYFASISRLVAARVRKFYKRSSVVIYPPVDTGWIQPKSAGSRKDFFLYAGALVPYKRVDVLIEVFNRNRLPFVVAGEGPQYLSLKKRAKKNITFVGRVSDRDLADLYSTAQALLFSGCEDFGMIPVEAMAAGTPVIAPFKGGCKETVRGIKHWLNERERQDCRRPTGVFFRYFGSFRKQAEEVLRAVYFFQQNKESFKSSYCAEQAGLFSPQRFKESWCRFVKLAVYNGELPLFKGRIESFKGKFERDLINQ